ncbi:MAG: trigger factor [Syntrophorhabdaceae bacterium]|nr:trigger factor [Syntrophorhabdaceae bacterium]
MKTSIDATEKSYEQKITVEIPAEDIDKRIEEQYAEIRKEVPLKGFRKGKAPMDMVRRFFKESVEADLSERIVKESLSDIIEEKDIKILSLGKIDADKVVSGQDFKFSATVEVVPEVEAKDYKGIEVVRANTKVSDEDVEAAVERLQTPYARFQPEEGRKAERGDLAEFSFKAVDSEGNKVDDNEKTSIVLIKGIPFGQEFEDKMIGVGAGEERSFEIDFPNDHPVGKYAGKKVKFDVQVFTVRERKLPALDDAFAQQFGAENIEGLRTNMRHKLETEAESKSKAGIEEQIRRKLYERNIFDVPPTMVKRQAMAMIGSTIEQMESSGVNLKKAKLDFDEMSEQLSASGEMMVRVGLLIDAIARQENLDVPYSEIEAEMKANAEKEGADFETYKEKNSSEEQMDSFRDRLLEQKVMKLLLDNAEVKEEVIG